MAKKGIKKGHCLVHGKLDKTNSMISKEGDYVRTRCKICRRDKNAINRVNTTLKKGFCQRHGTPKNVENNYQCRTCKTEWAKKDRKDNPQKYRDWQNNLRAQDRENVRSNEVARKYGITVEMYYQMLEDQNNLCAICNKPETRLGRGGDVSRLCVDHCHRTGKIRGLLCHACNTAIGKFLDKTDILESAIKYLRKHE